MCCLIAVCSAYPRALDDAVQFMQLFHAKSLAFDLDASLKQIKSTDKVRACGQLTLVCERLVHDNG